MRPVSSKTNARPFAFTLLIALTACLVGSSPASASLRDDYRQFLFQGRQLVPLNPRLEGQVTAAGIRTERVRITTESGQEAVVLIVRPSRARRYRTVLVQHFLGGSKDDALVLSLLSGFALRGYLGAAIDGRYHGERARTQDLPAAIDQALMTGNGQPWLIDTVFDILRTIDYLQTRPDVDSARIGVTGISEGGLETWMAAAADDCIKVAVPALGVTQFQCIIDAAVGPGGKQFADAIAPALVNFAQQLGEPEINEHVFRAAWERLLPGFSSGPFEATNLVPLIAPRPLLMLNHGKDEIIPLPCAQQVYDVTRQRYTQLGASKKVQLRVAPNLRHAAFDPLELIALYGWFAKWL